MVSTLFNQGGKLPQHFIDDEIGNLFDEPCFAGLQVEHTRLVAENDALGLRSGPLNDTAKPAWRAKFPPCVIGQTSGVPSKLKAFAETIRT